MSNEEINELKNLQYDILLEKCLKKEKGHILKNKYGFIRGIPAQLAEDMYAIRIEKIPENADKDMLERIKYICKYSLSKMPKSRKAKQNNIEYFIYDKFNQYQNALEIVEKRLKALQE
ncbi:hypothetical protein [uncultured Winogradskyella sp.]|uniref:hypothetical protein n=1 Tax=uncultured Winogradskyella sp. TaxID=395353 RepID=UPI00260E2493|nr:hypothetical protein [uncultured Winogradskyella sp.]